MKYGGGCAELTSGEYRTFLVGLCVPSMLGLFGVVLPAFAMLTGEVNGYPPFVLGPGFALGGWVQVDLVLAGGRNPARAVRAKRRLRGLLLVPMALISLALLVSTVGLLRLTWGEMYPAGYGLTVSLIGAAFLHFTVRARRIPWLQG